MHRLNARIVDGVLVREGEQIVIGDTDESQTRYQVLCRQHYRRGVLGP